MSSKRLPLFNIEKSIDYHIELGLQLSEVLLAASLALGFISLIWAI